MFHFKPAVRLAVCAAALISATSAAAQSGAQVIVPEAWRSVYESYHFAPAVRAGDLLILSGVVAGFGSDTADTDEEAAYVRAFSAIENILKEAGAEWDDVVEIQTFHTDLPAQFPLFSEVKDRYIKEPYPAWTAIDVDRLFPDRGIVEIKITAYLGE